MMFKVSLLVDEKKVGSTLAALDGMGYNLEAIPVRNAAPSKGKVKEIGSITGPKFLEDYARHLIGQGDDTMNRKYLLAEAERAGLGLGAMVNAITQSQLNGLIKKTDKRGVYAINANQLRS